MKKSHPSSCYFKNIIAILQKLHKKYPGYSVGRHLATALDERKDIWGMRDETLLFALEKYMAELEYDIHPQEIDDIDQIIMEGKNLSLLREDLYADED